MNSSGHGGNRCLPDGSFPSTLEKRNIIVLGLSLHGKSTLLNDLVQFQGGHQSASVGDGSARCTLVPEFLSSTAQTSQRTF